MIQMWRLSMRFLGERVPLELARLASADHYYDSSKAVRELGLPQTPIERALADAFAWYRQQAQGARRKARCRPSSYGGQA